jgi:NAD(P)-dependent dehydrogenase (short-subunit alcohol dehydrogenase family)
VTGANQGLGLAIAQAFVEAGAGLLICARDEGLLDQARRSLEDTCQPGQSVHARRADVSNAQDVARLAADALAIFPQIHILVNNAGVYGPFGASEEVPWDAWTRAIEINLYGSVLPCRAMLPHFKQHRYGKIIQISGGGATNPLPRISAYASAKAAIVRFAESLALEVKPYGIDVNAVAPGALNTRMMDELMTAGREAVGPDFYDRMLKTKAEGGAPLDRGAALAVFLGSAASDGITGRLLSAMWDPWETLAAHRADIEASDVYTLRRVTARDRGFDWGDR